MGLVRRSRHFLAELYTALKDDNAYTGAAALGFYLTLAIFPAVIFLMAVMPFLPIANVGDAIMDLLRQALPQSAADMLSDVVHRVSSEQRGGLLSLGFAGTVWAASTGMYAVMRQLNIAYDVEEGRSLVHARATAVGLTLLFGALVLCAFSLVVLGGVIQDWIGERWGFSGALLGFFAVFRWVVIVCALLLAFWIIYALAPNVDQRMSFFNPGGIAATVLLIVATLGFSAYTRNFGRYDALYGSVGAVIVLMLWLYVVGLVVIVGGEVNVLLERGGGKERKHAPRYRREQRPRAHSGRQVA